MTIKLGEKAFARFAEQLAPPLSGAVKSRPNKCPRPAQRRAVLLFRTAQPRSSSPGHGKGAAAEVLDPDGKRVLTLQEATTTRAVALNREGFYEIKTATGRQMMVAAHVDRRESDMAAIPQETLDLWKGTGSAQSTSTGGANPSQTNDLKKPWSLFPILILLLIAVSLAESIVANRYLKTAESGAGSIG